MKKTTEFERERIREKRAKDLLASQLTAVPCPCEAITRQILIGDSPQQLAKWASVTCHGNRQSRESVQQRFVASFSSQGRMDTAVEAFRGGTEGVGGSVGRFLQRSMNKVQRSEENFFVDPGENDGADWLEMAFFHQRQDFSQEETQIAGQSSSKGVGGGPPLRSSSSAASVVGLQENTSLNNKLNNSNKNASPLECIHKILWVTMLGLDKTGFFTLFKSWGIPLWAVQDARGQGLMHWAVAKEAVRCVRELIQIEHCSPGLSNMATFSCWALVKDVAGVTPLHQASALENDTILKLLLAEANSELFISPNESETAAARDTISSGMQTLPWSSITDVEHQSPLHYAAAAGSAACCELLMDRGHPVDGANHAGQTPLHYAALSPNGAPVVRLLATKKEVLRNCRDSRALTPVHLAVQANNLAVLDVLLDELAMSPLAFDEHSRTPLHYAAIGNSLEAAQTLINEGATNDTRDCYNVTPAHYAALNGSYELVHLLLQSASVNRRRRSSTIAPGTIAALEDANKKAISGAADILSTNVPRAQRRGGATKSNAARPKSLYGAVAGESPHSGGGSSSSALLTQFKNVLLNGAGTPTGAVYTPSANLGKGTRRSSLSVTPFAGGGEGGGGAGSGTILTNAIPAGTIGVIQPQVIRPLLTQPVDGEGRSPFMWAIVGQNRPLVQRMVAEKMVDVWKPQRDVHKLSPLHIAALTGNADICKDLIDANFSITETDEGGATPEHLAAGNGHVDTLNILAVTRTAGQHPLDQLNRTPFMYACLGGQFHLASQMLQMFKTIKNDDTDILKCTALHHAAYAGSLPCVKLLVERGFDPLAQNTENKTASVLAAERGHHEIAKFLKSCEILKTATTSGEVDAGNGGGMPSSSSNPGQHYRQRMAAARK